jgi:Xaa-Pro aminopeptidase
MLRRSPFGLAFPSIIAGGRNATVLHYLKNDEPLDPKGLVLMDFGARWGTMHADITRVVPVSGRFNPLQALIYGIVLDAAKENQRNAKPGATIRELNDKVWAFLEDALERRFLSNGGKAKRAYTGKPHGVSHLMGEQEHDGDPHRIYQDHPLQPGWQISNEPGLYGHFVITLGGKRYAEWIGIRIEDDLLITKTGCRNLSGSIPREIGEIERLMGNMGR